MLSIFGLIWLFSKGVESANYIDNEGKCPSTIDGKTPETYDFTKALAAGDVLLICEKTSTTKVFVKAPAGAATIQLGSANIELFITEVQSVTSSSTVPAADYIIKKINTFDINIKLSDGQLYYKCDTEYFGDGTTCQKYEDQPIYETLDSSKYDIILDKASFDESKENGALNIYYTKYGRLDLYDKVNERVCNNFASDTSCQTSWLGAVNQPQGDGVGYPKIFFDFTKDVTDLNSKILLKYEGQEDNYISNAAGALVFGRGHRDFAGEDLPALYGDAFDIKNGDLFDKSKFQVLQVHKFAYCIVDDNKVKDCTALCDSSDNSDIYTYKKITDFSEATNDEIPTICVAKDTSFDISGKNNNIKVIVGEGKKLTVAGVTSVDESIDDQILLNNKFQITLKSTAKLIVSANDGNSKTADSLSIIAGLKQVDFELEITDALTITLNNPTYGGTAPKITIATGSASGKTVTLEKYPKQKIIVGTTGIKVSGGNAVKCIISENDSEKKGLCNSVCKLTEDELDETNPYIVEAEMTDKTTSEYDILYYCEGFTLSKDPNQKSYLAFYGDIIIGTNILAKEHTIRVNKGVSLSLEGVNTIDGSDNNIKINTALTIINSGTLKIKPSSALTITGGATSLNFNLIPASCSITYSNEAVSQVHPIITIDVTGIAASTCTIQSAKDQEDAFKNLQFILQNVDYLVESGTKGSETIQVKQGEEGKVLTLSKTNSISISTGSSLTITGSNTAVDFNLITTTTSCSITYNNENGSPVHPTITVDVKNIYAGTDSIVSGGETFNKLQFLLKNVNRIISADASRIYVQRIAGGRSLYLPKTSSVTIETDNRILINSITAAVEFNLKLTQNLAVTYANYAAKPVHPTLIVDMNDFNINTISLLPTTVGPTEDHSNDLNANRFKQLGFGIKNVDSIDESSDDKIIIKKGDIALTLYKPTDGFGITLSSTSLSVTAGKIASSILVSEVTKGFSLTLTNPAKAATAPLITISGTGEPAITLNKYPNTRITPNGVTISNPTDVTMYCLGEVKDCEDPDKGRLRNEDYTRLKEITKDADDKTVTYKTADILYIASDELITITADVVSGVTIIICKDYYATGAIGTIVGSHDIEVEGALVLTGVTAITASTKDKFTIGSLTITKAESGNLGIKPSSTSLSVTAGDISSSFEVFGVTDGFSLTLTNTDKAETAPQITITGTGRISLNNYPNTKGLIYCEANYRYYSENGGDSVNCIKCGEGEISDGGEITTCSCDTDYTKSFDGTKCILKTTCTGTLNGEVDPTPESHCQCQKYLNKAGTECISACDSLTEYVDEDTKQCKCKNGYFVSLDGESCIAECESGAVADSTDNNKCKCSNSPKLTIKKDYSGCTQNCGTGEEAKDGKCVCASGNFESLDKKSCLTKDQCEDKAISGKAKAGSCTCEDPTPNIKSDYSACVADGECGPGETDTDGGNCVCIKSFIGTCFDECPDNTDDDDKDGVCTCKDGFSLINSASNDCTKACGGTEYKSLDGSRCLSSASKCGSNTEGDSTKKVCKCKAAYPYINVQGTGCVAQCGESEFISLDGSKCLTGCGANTETSGGKCVCQAGKLIKPDYSGCTSGNTCESGEVISLDGSKCLTGGDDKNPCETLYENLNVKTNNGVCECNKDYVKSLDQTKCITETACEAISNAEVKSSKCVCKEGYEFVNGECKINCADNAVLEKGLCKCKAGYAGTNAYKGGLCTQCPQNDYSKQGATECSRCPLGYTNEGAGSSECPICANGFIYNAGKCSSCGEHKTSDGGKSTLCKCSEGYSGTNCQLACKVSKAPDYPVESLNSESCIPSATCIGATINGIVNGNKCECDGKNNYYPNLDNSKCIKHYCVTDGVATDCNNKCGSNSYTYTKYVKKGNPGETVLSGGESLCIIKSVNFDDDSDIDFGLGGTFEIIFGTGGSATVSNIDTIDETDSNYISITKSTVTIISKKGDLSSSKVTITQGKALTVIAGTPTDFSLTISDDVTITLSVPSLRKYAPQITIDKAAAGGLKLLEEEPKYSVGLIDYPYDKVAVKNGVTGIIVQEKVFVVCDETPKTNCRLKDKYDAIDTQSSLTEAGHLYTQGKILVLIDTLSKDLELDFATLTTSTTVTLLDPVIEITNNEPAPAEPVGDMKLLGAEPKKVLISGTTELKGNKDKSTELGGNNNKVTIAENSGSSVEVGFTSLTIKEDENGLLEPITGITLKPESLFSTIIIDESVAHLDNQQFTVKATEENNLVVMKSTESNQQYTEKQFDSFLTNAEGSKIKITKDIEFKTDPPAPQPEPAPAAATTTTTEDSGLSGGAIAGIVIACIVVVAGAVIAVIFILKKRKSGGDDDKTVTA